MSSATPKNQWIMMGMKIMTLFVKKANRLILKIQKIVILIA